MHREGWNLHTCFFTCVACMLCSENMYTTHCMKYRVVKLILNLFTSAGLNELFTRHLLTAEECSELAKKWRKWELENHLAQVLVTKPAMVLQESSQVLAEHGYCGDQLKSGLYYSSTLDSTVL